MSSVIEQLPEKDNISNPLDTMEDLFITNNWVYQRHGTETIQLKIQGRSSLYFVSLTWDEESRTLNFICYVNEEIPEEKMGEAILVVNEINQNTKIGFFYIDYERKSLTHLYRLMFLDNYEDMTSRMYLGRIVERILEDCEDNAALFKCFLSKDISHDDKDLISLLIMPAEGSA